MGDPRKVDEGHPRLRTQVIHSTSDFSYAAIMENARRFINHTRLYEKQSLLRIITRIGIHAQLPKLVVVLNTV